MLKIAVCDDETTALRAMEENVSLLLSQAGKQFEIQCFESAAALRQKAALYDVILLDIQMPDYTGIDLARELQGQKNPPALIFITALEDYVYDSFEYEAVDYLLKPVDFGRLLRALLRAETRIRSRGEKRFFIPTSGGGKSVRLDAIHYCEVINRKVYVHTSNGVIDYYGKIEEAQKQLDERFVKCHRSYLVNLDHVAEYSGGQILLENGGRVPVSRLRHQEFMAAMLQYLKPKGD